MTEIRTQQLERIRNGIGFIGALDQSGGSTPAALNLYGVDDTWYSTNDEMFRLVHEMRTRIIKSPSFDHHRLLGAILFEDTIDRAIGGLNSADYLWEKKRIVPFLKVDKGLAHDVDGSRVMKPIPDLSRVIDKAKTKGAFGTKMRSVIGSANAKGVESVVSQQFEVAKEIISSGLVPIIEPEVDIHATDKLEAEELLRVSLRSHVATLDDDDQVMLKLTLPEIEDFYIEFVDHSNVARVVALSGGYSRDEANRRLSHNKGVVASFSRALTEGLSIQQPDDEFGRTLDEAIESIYQASCS